MWVVSIQQDWYNFFMTTYNKLVISSILNVLLFSFEIVGNVLCFSTNKFGALQYYTVLSNLFAQIASAIYLFFLIKKIRNADFVIPKFAQMIKYLSTCCLAITFTIVIFVLIPMNGKDSLIGFLFRKDAKYLHVICPLLAIISFIFFENNELLPDNAQLFSIIPTAVYGIIVFILNALEKMHGPYKFLFIHEQPVYMTIIWFIVIFGIAYLIGLGLKKSADMEMHRI